MKRYFITTQGYVGCFIQLKYEFAVVDCQIFSLNSHLKMMC